MPPARSTVRAAEPVRPARLVPPARTTHCPPPGRLLVARAATAAAQPGCSSPIEGGRARRLCRLVQRCASARDRRRRRHDAARQGALRKRPAPSVELAPLEDPEPLRRRLPRRRLGGLRSSRDDRQLADRHRRARISRPIGRRGPASCATPPSARPRPPASTSRSIDRFDAGAWAAYEAVYRGQLEARGRLASPSCARSPSRRARPGTLRLGIARKDGRPLAAQLWLVEDGEATIHKLAYREDAKALSPGTVLEQAMFRRAIDEDRVARDRLRHRRRRLQARLDGASGDRSGGSRPSTRARSAALPGAARAALSALVRRARSR